MLMIKTTCDFCPEALEPKPATGTVQIENMIYDVCDDCKKEMKALLNGKGRAALTNGSTAPVIVPFVYPPTPCPPVGTPPVNVPFIGDPPYHQWPTVICQNTCSAQGTSNANPR